MKIKYILSFLILIIIQQQLTGQKIPDISGYWNGIIEVDLAKNITAEYYFTQSGALLSGYMVGKSMNMKDSSKSNFTGTVSSKSIAFKGTDYIYKVGTGCLSNVKLTYSNIAGQEKLEGTWFGDWSLSTCPPGVKGKIELLKVPPSTHFTQQQTTHKSEQINVEHTTGNTNTAMVDLLKQRNYYALIIGIDTYDDDLIEDLNNPVADAKAIQNMLQEYYTFSPRNTISLFNPSRDEIIEAFDALNDKITSNDQLLVFYAGHGIWEERMKQGYWLPADAANNSKARWISNSTIRDYIGGLRSKHTLLITDACFSGGIFKERGFSVVHDKAMVEMDKLPSRKAMTSGMLTTVPDNSVFVEYLLKNMKNHDQALLSTEYLFQRFKIAVINNSANGQVPQYGAINQVGDEGGDFIFLRRTN